MQIIQHLHYDSNYLQLVLVVFFLSLTSANTAALALVVVTLLYGFIVIIIRVDHVQKYTRAVLPHAELCHS